MIDPDLASLPSSPAPPPGYADASLVERATPPPLMTRRELTLVVSLLALLGALLGTHTALRRGWGRPVPEIVPAPPPAPLVIDLNSADAEELALLESIGPVRAEAIVVERRTGGLFRSVGDLTRVRGIGSKTIERLRPYLRVSDPTERP